MLADALEHLVRGIVEHPDDVKVRVRQQRYRETLQVRVHPEDLGRVIGRSGRTAKSIRTAGTSRMVSWLRALRVPSQCSPFTT